MKLTPDQQQALDTANDWVLDRAWAPVLAMTGPAGTGKTTMLKEFKDAFDHIRVGNEALPVIWTATTGKAARRLKEAIKIDTKTLHSTLYFPPKDSKEAQKTGPVFEALQPAPSNAIVVVDEASMITPKIAEDINSWIEQGTRFILVGDPWQLPPIISKPEAKKYGEHFTVFSGDSGVDALDVTLTTVVRTQNDLLDVVTHLREEQRLPRDNTYESFEFRRGQKLMTALDDWLDDPEEHVLVTWRNKLRMQGNEYIRDKLGRRGHLPEPGEPILFCRNGQGVLNGEITTVTHIGAGPKFGSLLTHEIRVEGHRHPIIVSLTGRETPLDGGLPWIDKWGEYRGELRKYAKSRYGDDARESQVEPVPITWGYVLTVHKAQGSEWRRVSVFLTPGDANSKPFKENTVLPDGSTISFGVRWMYTALTRAREQATLVIG